MSNKKIFLELIDDLTGHDTVTLSLEGFGVTTYTTREIYNAISSQIRAWISVTDRMPEADPDTKYLVCARTKSGYRSINLAWYDGSFWHGMGSMAGVTHWMPLPDLPEVEA
jgi:hypothetical protein